MPRLHNLLLLALLSLLGGCEQAPYRTATVATRDPTPGVDAGAVLAEDRVLRFSVAAIESPRDTFSSYTQLFERVGQLLGRPVRFEQRRTYREVNELLVAGELDAALLCTGGYLDLQARAPRAVEAVAVPMMDGRASYQSTIVVSTLSGVRELAQLKGKRIAFSDELSYSGRLYPLALLRQHGFDPEHFFASVSFTGSHDRSVQAVAAGLVDGAGVHGGVLAQLMARDPTLADKLRIIHRSPPVGAMPVVVSTRLPLRQRNELREVLLALDRDPEAAATLGRLRFDRFVTPPPDLYGEAARLLEVR